MPYTPYKPSKAPYFLLTLGVLCVLVWYGTIFHRIYTAGNNQWLEAHNNKIKIGMLIERIRELENRKCP